MRALSIASMLAAALAGARPSEPADPSPSTKSIEAPGIIVQPPLVSWQDLYEHPAQWLGREVRIRIQFQTRVEDWNPYMTRFGTAQFLAVQGWTDEQFPWVVSDFEAPAVRVFARRNGPCEWPLQSAKPYSRYELSGTVREVFLDLPWIEIQDARLLPDQISEATVIHASRAVDLNQQKSWKLAELEFDQALAGPLPDKARIELERLREATRAAASDGRQSVVKRPQRE